MNQQIGKLILSPEKPNSILEIFVARKDLVEKSNLGQLFLLVEINSREKGIKEKIKQIIDLVQNDYYSSPVPSVESSLETTCQNLNLNLVEILQKPEIWFKKVNILIGVFKDDFLVLSSFGQFSGYLVRNKKTTQILDSSLEESSFTNFFSQLTTGEIKFNDILVLSNYALFDFFSLEKIREVTSKLKAEKSVEQFKNLLKENVKIPHILSLVIKYEQEICKTELPDEQTQKYLKDLYGSEQSMQQLENLEQRTGRTLKSSFAPSLKKIKKVLSFKLKKSSKEKSNLKILKNKKKIFKFRKPDLEVHPVKSSKAGIPSYSELFDRVKNIFSKSDKTKSESKQEDSKLNIKPTKKETNFEKPKKSKSKFNLVTIIIILVIIFASSLIYLHFHKNYKNKIANYENILIEVNNKKDEAEAALIYQDDEKATTLLNQAFELLTGLPADKEEWKIKSDEQKIKITKLINKINNIYEVEIAEIANLESIGLINQIIKKGDFIYALINENKVYKISTTDESITELYSDLNAKSISDWEEKGFLILDNLNQIYFRHDNENELLNISLDKENKINNIVAYGDRIYYLDKTIGAIYKISQPTSANPNITVWTQKNKELLSQAQQMIIDGNIWLINNNEIVKLFKGEQEEFILSKLDEKLGVDLKFYTEQDWNYLYILDKINSRILQIDKDGVAHQQFLNEKIKDADNLLINNSEDLAFFNIENKIYQIEIKVE